MTKIKYCGLSRECDIEMVNKLNIDYIGFVFFSKSKRYVSPEKALELRKKLNPDIKVVGVLVDMPIDEVLKLLMDGVIDIPQLHGHEDEEYIKKLRARIDELQKSVTVFKAFRIDSPEDVERANNSSADLVLVDSGNGGTGTVFDWNLLKDMKRDYLLAGGLNEENIAEAIKIIKPYGIDVSSGIETDGLKDMVKMEKLHRLIKEAEND